jgi:hypothetical protein
LARVTLCLDSQSEYSVVIPNGKGIVQMGTNTRIIEDNSKKRGREEKISDNEKYG